jgi:hypothetical protein
MHGRLGWRYWPPPPVFGGQNKKGCHAGGTRQPTVVCRRVLVAIWAAVLAPRHSHTSYRTSVGAQTPLSVVAPLAQPAQTPTRAACSARDLISAATIVALGSHSPQPPGRHLRGRDWPPPASRLCPLAHAADRHRRSRVTTRSRRQHGAQQPGGPRAGGSAGGAPPPQSRARAHRRSSGAGKRLAGEAEQGAAEGIRVCRQRVLCSVGQGLPPAPPPAANRASRCRLLPPLPCCCYCCCSRSF